MTFNPGAAVMWLYGSLLGYLSTSTLYGAVTGATISMTVSVLIYLTA